MKIFCDNILIAGFCESHPQHNSARPVLERVQTGKDQGFVSAHSLAETYAVLTRLPGDSYVPPGTAWQLISENVLRHFTVINLTPKEYAQTLEESSTRGVEGGLTYDALLLAAAAKSGADRVLTFNVKHFQSIAGENLVTRILAP